MITKDLVVTRYNKSTEWTSGFNGRVIIYQQSNDILDYKATVSTSNSIKISNVGRESHGYLLHIVKNYHNLADITIFSQDDGDMHCRNLLNMINGINCSTNYYFEQYSDSSPFTCCYNHNIPDTNDQSESNDLSLFKSTKSLIKRHLPSFIFPDSASMKPHAIFAVHKNNILIHPLTVYECILDEMDSSKYPKKHVEGIAWFLEYGYHLLFDSKYHNKL